MRAARSASEENTTALPSMLEQLGVGGRALEDRALGREIAEQRDQAALGSIGASRAAMIERSIHASPSASRSPSVSPVTVMQSRCSSGLSSRSSAPMPPAAKKSSM